VNVKMDRNRNMSSTCHITMDIPNSTIEINLDKLLSAFLLYTKNAIKNNRIVVPINNTSGSIQ
jgi:hypothetical protein